MIQHTDFKFLAEIVMSTQPTDKDSIGVDGLFCKSTRIIKSPQSKVGCPKCDLLDELYSHVQKNSRNYYVMTELFCMLHGDDKCKKESQP